MVAFTLHLASASHPAVEGERYVHSTASPSVAPPLEPKIKTEASRLILQSDDVELRLDSRFQATSVRPCTVAHTRNNSHPLTLAQLKPSTCAADSGTESFSPTVRLEDLLLRVRCPTLGVGTGGGRRRPTSPPPHCHRTSCSARVRTHERVAAGPAGQSALRLRSGLSPPTCQCMESCHVRPRTAVIRRPLSSCTLPLSRLDR